MNTRFHDKMNSFIVKNDKNKNNKNNLSMFYLVINLLPNLS